MPCTRHICTWQHPLERQVQKLQRLRRYYYFGNRTSELITADLAERSPFTGRSLLVHGLTLDRFVNVCIALNAWTTYPVLVVVLQVSTVPLDVALGWSLRHIPCIDQQLYRFHATSSMRNQSESGKAVGDDKLKVSAVIRFATQHG